MIYIALVTVKVLGRGGGFSGEKRGEADCLLSESCKSHILASVGVLRMKLYYFEPSLKVSVIF